MEIICLVGDCVKLKTEKRAEAADEDEQEDYDYKRGCSSGSDHDFAK